jgi:aminopeptidase N
MSLLNANSYQKGAWVLHMLRNEVGDTVFRQIIQTYYNGYKGGNAETKEFEAVAEKVSGKELTLFFNQWLYRPEIPKLEVLWIPEQGLIRVSQMQKETFQLPLEVSYATEDNTRKTITLPVSKRVQEFKAEGIPKNGSLLLDPQCKLLFTGSVMRGFWKKRAS